MSSNIFDGNGSSPKGQMSHLFRDTTDPSRKPDGSIRKVVIQPSYKVDFDPEEWNDPFLEVDDYSYALNIPEIGANAIGRLIALDNGGADISSPEAIHRNLMMDDLEKFETCPGDSSHVIAVFAIERGFQAKEDMKVYRRDSNGLWSQLLTKGRGCSAVQAVTQKDFSGNDITDPTQCDHGYEATLVGYYGFRYDPGLMGPAIEIVPKIETGEPIRNAYEPVDVFKPPAAFH